MNGDGAVEDQPIKILGKKQFRAGIILSRENSWLLLSAERKTYDKSEEKPEAPHVVLLD
jgi:hypothetical protein